ncbi:BTAD domain-containing putative transcriptional regulator [Actinomadura sp. DC4]|uniref:BTAD domain-containing putative transcriptional regulator n=1 Tax=Actinomadura sp. DC4 TaxID=3055069 RepID=UPI0025B0584D|nr:BTAD domain-containing putative transcriptional regulator [Actinomadura sp. DC4]MDN3354823.1 BTAD domain-containing putative transcriptional regulator [Actinomadura sp. DC4]
MSDHVRFGLLGPLEAWSGNVRLNLGPPKRRVLLLRLLVENGHPVSADRLCDDLWEGHPPAGAVSSIHSHISRLRDVLEPERALRGQGTVLVSGPAGYTLAAPPDTRDSNRFEEAVNRSRGLLARGRLVDAQSEVERGLSLWRGTPLTDAADHAFAAREIARLEEIRMAAGELKATVLLQQGEPEKAVLVAEDLATRAPLREAAWALLMRALYLAGRSAEALRSFETIRMLLSEELGAVPGPELSGVHMGVLRQDLPAPAYFRSHAAPAAPAPQPAGAAGPLVGRADELARFDELLSDAAQGNTRWVLLSGEAGIGKTRLAEEFASRSADAAFRVVWVRCGLDIAVEEEEEEGDVRVHPLSRLLSALYPQIRIEGGPEAVARDLAERLTEQPTICLIEDLHRAGPRFRRSLGMYARLLRDVPMVVVCTTQDADDVGLRELLAVLVRQSRATLLPLGPLTVADVHELLKRHSTPFTPGLPGTDLHQREAAALHRRGEGNPFLITEILELPSDRRTGPDAQLPASVSRVLRARMDLLDDRVRKMLEAVAVTGGELDVELLLQMRTITREELLSILDASVIARALNWEDDTAPGRPGRYLMPDLTRELVLHDLTPARRQVLHAAAAHGLGELRKRHPVHIARHLMAAGPLVARDELIDAALRAGNRCAEDDQHAEAALWFDHASAMADDPGVRAEARHAADAARRQLAQLDRLQQWTGHPCDPAGLPDDDTWPEDSEPRVS